MPALNQFIEAELREITPDMRRRLVGAESLEGGRLRVKGKEYWHFCANDYLGLAHHPALKQAARLAVDTMGAGASASRLVTGNHAGYAALETALCEHLGAEAACVFSSGYAANLGVMQALMGKGDVIFADKLAHASMVDGARLSGAKLIRFKHNDMAHLEQLLSTHRGQYQNALIITEHVFSMDGDISPIDDIITLKNKYDSWLMVDDAHGIGIVECKAKKSVDIWLGTLSKTLASVGGYVLGSAPLKEYLVNHARSLIYSTGLPPSITAQATAALKVMKNEPWRKEKVMRHAQRFTQALGLPMAQSPIVPVIIGKAEDAVRASEALKQKGFYVSAIRPPTVPENTARLRICFSAAHSDEAVEGLIAAVKALHISL